MAIPGPQHRLRADAQIEVMPIRALVRVGLQGRMAMKAKEIGTLLVLMIASLATHSARGQTEILPADFDPLAPGGIVIGMTGAEAVERLEANGFGANSSRSFHLHRGLIQHGVRFSLGTTGVGEMDDPVSEIAYSGSYAGLDPSLEEVIGSLNGRFGTPGDCTVSNQKARCRWETPPLAPLVWWIGARLDMYQAYRIDLTLKGVTDLDERLEVGAAPNRSTASQIPPEYWWQQELAEMHAEETRFADGQIFSQLSGEHLQRLQDEAVQVFAYCKEQNLFSALHDCGCIAERFVDERLVPEDEDQPENGFGGMTLDLPGSSTPRDITSIANDVAEHCPNKAGAANYAFNKCVGQYSFRLGTATEPFCVCYAEKYAEGYMREPRAHISHLTGIGSGALQACHDEGIESPLSR